MFPKRVRMKVEPDNFGKDLRVQDFNCYSAYCVSVLGFFIRRKGMQYPKSTSIHWSIDKIKIWVESAFNIIIANGNFMMIL